MRLNAITIGNGSEPVVLLHGFMGSGKNLRTVAQRWSAEDPHKRFFLPDLSGHGESPPVSDRTDLRAIAQDVIESARAEGLQGPLDFVGHSLGGRVSLAASLVAPNEVNRVALLDITPSPIQSITQSGKVIDVLVQAPDEATDRRDLRAFLVGKGLTGPLADWLMMNVYSDNGRYRWRIDRRSLQRLHSRVNHEDMWEGVERLRDRAVCIRGAESPYVPEEDAKRMEALGCHVHTLQGAGHFLHVDALDALLQIVIPFFAGRPGN